MFRQKEQQISLKTAHTPVRGMLMAAANSRTGRGLLLWPCVPFTSFSRSLWREARPDPVSRTVHKLLLSTLSFQTRRPCFRKLLLNLWAAPGRPVPRPEPTHYVRSSHQRTLTTQMLERAWSSAFTRKPPKSESISNPPVLANSTLGSRPTAATMWSVSTWGQKEFSQWSQFPRIPTVGATVHHVIKSWGFTKKSLILTLKKKF